VTVTLKDSKMMWWCYDFLKHRSDRS